MENIFDRKQIWDNGQQTVPAGQYIVKQALQPRSSSHRNSLALFVKGLSLVCVSKKPKLFEALSPVQPKLPKVCVISLPHTTTAKFSSSDGVGIVRGTHYFAENELLQNIRKKFQQSTAVLERVTTNYNSVPATYWSDSDKIPEGTYKLLSVSCDIQV